MVFVVFPNIIETVWRRKLSVACLPGLQVQGWAPAWLWTVKKHLRKKGRKGWGDIPGRNEPLNQNVEARARWWWASREKEGNSKWELGKRPPVDSPAQEQEDFSRFTYFLSSVVGLRCCTRLFSIAVSGHCSLVAVWGLLIAVASLVSELGLVVAAHEGLVALWQLSRSRLLCVEYIKGR